MFSRLIPLTKILGLIPFIKLQALLLVAKTAFIFIFYKFTDLGVFFLQKIPLFERGGRFSEMRDPHSISVSPALQNLLIENISRLENINREV